MRAFAPDGRLLWRYPNRWSGVHGSHHAPLPSPGELQGVLFFTGVAPLDDTADVMLMNGNHGRAFVMTTDGLYLDEVFPDCRMMTNPQAGGVGILGGECFGGAFGRSQTDGNYYFQGGGIEYRIYRIDGLNEIVRAARVVHGHARAGGRRRARPEPNRRGRCQAAEREDRVCRDASQDQWPRRRLDRASRRHNGTKAISSP